MTTQETPKQRQLVVKMDNELYESFKRIASINDRPMGQLVRDFVKEYVKKNGQGDLFK